ncbi:RPM1-interacting protein 4-like, partial [Trifolium pratense]
SQTDRQQTDRITNHHPPSSSPPPALLFSSCSSPSPTMAEKGIPLPKFGEWDVNDPASAEGYTVIFNKARNEKKTGAKIDSPPKDNHKNKYKNEVVLGKPPQHSCAVTNAIMYANFLYSNRVMRISA